MFHSFMNEFDNDPFFSGHRERMSHVFDMRPFFDEDPRLAVTEGDDRTHRRHGERGHSQEVVPHRSQRGSEMIPTGYGYDPFGMMNSMMSNMNQMMGNVFRQMESVRGDPNAHSYMQSSVMTYSNLPGQGQPKIYQATTATRTAPGGIRETKKAVRDSEAGIEKMAVGRHLNERGHIVTRERNTRSGDMTENQDYVNLDESEAPQFDDEWQRRASQYAPRRDNAVGYHRQSRSDARAIADRPTESRAVENRDRYDVPAHRSQRPTAHHRDDTKRHGSTRYVEPDR